jgi:hypothetical protein
VPGHWIHNLATGKLVRTIHVAFVEYQPAHVPTALLVAPCTSQASPPSGLESRGSHHYCQSLVRGHQATRSPDQQPFHSHGRYSRGRPPTLSMSA